MELSVKCEPIASSQESTLAPDENNNVICYDTHMHHKTIQERKLKQCISMELVKSVQHNDFTMFQRLLIQKPDLNFFIDGKTVLHYCLYFGREVRWLEELISNGANPQLSTKDGWHPLHLAYYSATKETIDFLRNAIQMEQFRFP